MRYERKKLEQRERQFLEREGEKEENLGCTYECHIFSF